MNEKKNLYRITGRATVMDAVEATDTETAPETFHGQEPCVPRQEIRGHQGRGTCGWRMDFPTMIYEQEAAQIADERWHDMNIGDKGYVSVVR